MSKMEPAEIRMECLKLAHRHDFTADQVVERAKQFEQFVTGGQPATNPFDEHQPRSAPGAQQGKAGNRRAG